MTRIASFHRAAGAALLFAFAPAVQAQSGYQQTNLVSNIPGLALATDPNLINPWGIAVNPSPTGVAWVSDNGTGVSTLYDGKGGVNSLVVTVPTPTAGDTSSPTGQVFYGGSGFVVSDGAVSGPSRFIFATEDGTISGWNPAVPAPAPSTHAHFGVDNSASGAVYKGLALADEKIYATDFHNNKIDVYDSHFSPAPGFAGKFSDPNLPAGYAPFGIQTVGSSIYVTYALQKGAAARDDDAGPGHGFVDVYDTNGNLVKRLASQGKLNSPWGLAVAPSNFGALSNDLLVGNFGDGTINAYDPNTGAFAGQVLDAFGNPLAIDGLWGLAFGIGSPTGGPNTLLFTAGLNDEKDGLFGRITAVPEPDSVALLFGVLSAGGLLTRRRKRQE